MGRIGQRVFVGVAIGVIMLVLRQLLYSAGVFA